MPRGSRGARHRGKTTMRGRALGSTPFKPPARPGEGLKWQEKPPLRAPGSCTFSLQNWKNKLVLCKPPGVAYFVGAARVDGCRAVLQVSSELEHVVGWQEANPNHTKVFKFFFNFLFIYDSHRERERGTDTGGGRSRLHAPGARCGIRSRVSRIAPWAKGRRQTSAPPRDPL